MHQPDNTANKLFTTGSYRPLHSLSFFSGIGGLDKGAQLAGINTLLQSDYREMAGRAFELNRPDGGGAHLPHHLQSHGVYLAGRQGDISLLKMDTMRDAIQKNSGVDIYRTGVDVIFGGPPCQDISALNGNRGPFQDRNELIFYLLDIARRLRPKVVLIEQVPAILGVSMVPLLCRVLATMNSLSDYCFDYRVLNARNYGARQDRRRIIFMMVRKDLGVRPSFPAGTEPDLDKVSVNSLLPHVTHYSSGQFSDDIKCARSHVMCTLTAGASEKVYTADGKGRRATLEERLVLSELEGYNLKGLSEVDQKTLVGNMVQISFAAALFRHIRTHILRC